VSQRALNLGCHTPIDLNRLELREQLVHSQSVILLGPYNGLELSASNRMIQRVQELDGSIMIIVREYVNIGPHVVHHNHKPLEQGIDGLTGEMSEVLVLSPVSRIQPSLNLSISHMSFLQLCPNSKSQVLRMHPIEFGLTQHETSSRPPCCWRRTCPSILEQGSSSDGHKLCPP
jgi:hypothetical protein